MIRPAYTTFAVLLLCVCANSEEEEQKFYYDGHEYDRTALGDSVDLASMKLLKAAYDAAEDKNVIASPLGVLTLLSLYADGAEGPVRDELVAALGATDYRQLSTSYSTLMQRFTAMDPSYLALANKIFVHNHNELLDSFKETAVNTYKSDIEKVDFSKKAETAAIINKWSDEKTKGHIKTPVKESDLPDEAVAALVNVIFFQGKWSVPFNASETEEKDFHVDSKTTVKKPMMKLKQSLFYTSSEDLGAKIIELPYQETHFRMVVILPDEVDGLSAVLEKVQQKGILTETFNLNPAGTEVHLEFPKFEIKNRLDLKKLLPKVKVSKIFDEPAGGILDVPVKVGKAFQEAVVKVDEEGATATAFTGLVIDGYSSLPQPEPTPIVFKADHPFLFAILHQDIVLFTGTFTH